MGVRVVKRNRINRDRCGDGVGRRLLGTPSRCYISKWGSGETVFLVEINSSLQINMRVWSAHFDFSLSSSFPFLLPSFLSSFLHFIYATNISKHLLGAGQYAIKDPDSFQIAFILG